MYPRAACMRAMSCSACMARSLSLISSPLHIRLLDARFRGNDLLIVMPIPASRVVPGSATLQRGLWSRAGARRSQEEGTGAGHTTWASRMKSPLVFETQEYLGVMVENLVDVLGRQA